jgi:hypothetical protein
MVVEKKRLKARADGVIQIGIFLGKRRTNLYSHARQCPRKWAQSHPHILFYA